jgi:hypothetical protein
MNAVWHGLRADTGRPREVAGQTLRPREGAGQTLRPREGAGQTLRPREGAGQALRPREGAGRYAVGYFFAAAFRALICLAKRLLRRAAVLR